MSILIVSNSDLTLPSAANNRLLAIARGITEHGFPVIWLLVSNAPSTRISADQCYKDIEFVALLPKNHNRKNRVFRKISSLIALLSIHRSIEKLKKIHPIDACLTVGSDYVQLRTIQIACKANGIAIFHERTEYPLLFVSGVLHKLNYSFYMRRFIPCVDHIFVISEGLRKFFENELELLGCRIPISILNMMVEMDRFPDNCMVSDKLDVVYVGTMYGDKDGVLDLVRAFKVIADEFPLSRLVLVGDNSQEDNLTELYDSIYAFHDPSRIVCTGSLEREEVVKIICSSYCVALSRPRNTQAQYGFPTKLGEYLASGKPVVITKVGDIPLFLKDEESAYLAEPDSIDSFAERLRVCLGNPKVAFEIGKKGRFVCENSFCHFKAVHPILNALGSMDIGSF